MHRGAGSGAAGIGLIRQEHWAGGDTGSGTPAALLLPLQGHLGTSLGAVDEKGRLVETIGHDAFGQRTDGTVAVQSHRFAGEYWDEDAQLVYLRARWYDPRLGRFISGDPFEGRQGNPRSLNRYSYAHGDPVHGRDPTGRFSIGEVGTSLSNIAGMATRAYNTYDYLSMLAPGSDEEDVLEDRRETIWDSLMATLADQVMGSLVTDSGAAATVLAAAARKTTDGHHTVPMYMCGHRSQTLSEIPIDVHGPLHMQLYGFDRAITFAGKGFAVLFKKKQSGEKKSYVKRMAETKGGRGAIARGLQFFYTQEGYASIGTPLIGSTLIHEGARYVRAHLHRSCK